MWKYYHVINHMLPTIIITTEEDSVQKVIVNVLAKTLYHCRIEAEKTKMVDYVHVKAFV